jgi:6-phosphofructokinase
MTNQTTLRLLRLVDAHVAAVMGRHPTDSEIQRGLDSRTEFIIAAKELLPTEAQIDSTAADIASDTSCCDISSSSASQIAGHIRKLLGLPPEAD